MINRIQRKNNTFKIARNFYQSSNFPRCVVYQRVVFVRPRYVFFSFLFFFAFLLFVPPLYGSVLSASLWDSSRPFICYRARHLVDCCRLVCSQLGSSHCSVRCVYQWETSPCVMSILCIKEECKRMKPFQVTLFFLYCFASLWRTLRRKVCGKVYFWNFDRLVLAEFNFTKFGLYLLVSVTPMFLIQSKLSVQALLEYWHLVFWSVYLKSETKICITSVFIAYEYNYAQTFVVRVCEVRGCTRSASRLQTRVKLSQNNELWTVYSGY